MDNIIKLYKITMNPPKCKKSFDVAGMQNIGLISAGYMMDCLKANHPDCTYSLVNKTTGKVVYII